MIYSLVPDWGANASRRVRSSYLCDVYPDHITEISVAKRFKFNELTHNVKNSNVYLVKNFSIIRVAVLRFVFRNHVISDVNDPIHLREHAGRLGYLKVFFLLLLSNRVVFESLEYMDFWSVFKAKSVIIEDTPQEEWHGDVSIKEDILIWFGSTETVRALVGFRPFIHSLAESKKIYFLGVEMQDLIACLGLNANFVAIANYDFPLLKSFLERAKYALCLMPNLPCYEFRGNLKAKLALAFGCIPLMSDLEMHRRIEKNFGGKLLSPMQVLERSVVPKFEPKKVVKIASNVMKAHNAKCHMKALQDAFQERG